MKPLPIRNREEIIRRQEIEIEFLKRELIIANERIFSLETMLRIVQPLSSKGEPE